MKDRYFLDTNIFVYSFDHSHPAKQKKSQLLIDEALSQKKGVTSYQVVQEFLNVASRKFKKPFDIKDSKLYLNEVLGVLCEVYPSTELYQLALDLKGETGYGFYDSLILASAIESECKIVFSEDMQDGQRISGVLIKNPF